ncbi:hypothetical protein RR46_00790 [Papilio xuthus]|uniref:Uncharacterized protein n=1 Tax=Papilio xuthus TaxID=66420 RepID=A0A0N1PG30_PAPXU|nr:hypothetical protein RR46_00790 [Papilio xuthus]
MGRCIFSPPVEQSILLSITIKSKFKFKALTRSTTAPSSPRVIERGDIGLSHRATTSGIPHVFQAGDAMQAHPQAWGPYDINVAAPPGPLPAFQEVGVTSALPQAGASSPPGPYPAFQEVGVTSAPPQAGVFFSAGLGASLGQRPLAAPPVRLLGRSLPADEPVTQPAPTATTSSHMPHHTGGCRGNQDK